jgi:hypothetical protein
VKLDEREPHRGIKVWRNESPQALIVRLHYSASDAKNPATPEGQAWVEAGKKSAPSEEWWNQEQEIDFGARQGSRVYHQFKDDETQLVDPFPIPHEWTRYFILDTHPRKPHAMLWAAMSPHRLLYAYRELWPSKAYGTNKNIPEDDNQYPIRWYCEAVKWLESAENPENAGQKEKIYERIIDYAARAFGKDAQNPDAIDYQERYENFSREIDHPMYFEDCVKDNEANYAEVNEWLRPVPTMGKSGEIEHKSRLRIFRNLVELRWELTHNRIRLLQPHQVDVKDPDMKVIEKRNDLSDCAKYLCAAKPEFRKPVKPKKAVYGQQYEGIYS